MSDSGTSSGRVSSTGPVKPVSGPQEKGTPSKEVSPTQSASPRFRPLLDAYRAKTNPMEHLHKMRQAIFRIGIKHKVSALADQIQRKLQPGKPERSQKQQEGGIIREGRLIKIPTPKSDKSTEPTILRQTVPPRPLEVPKKSKEELLPFEKVFMAHFEGGVQIGEKLPPGLQKFLQKSEEAWTQFFQRFLPFAQNKTVSLKEIQMLIFRGLVKQGLLPGTDQKYPVLVSDLKFVSGKTERYARIQIQSQDFLGDLARMTPGDVISRESFLKVMEKLGLADLVYQSLSHRVVNPEMIDPSKGPLGLAYLSPEKMKEQAIRDGVRDEKQGMALSRRTEELMAKHLDIDLRPPKVSEPIVERREPIMGAQQPGFFSGLFMKKNKKGGLWGSSEGMNENQPAFIPWYQQVLRFQKHPGKVRWWVPLIYLVTASTIAFAIYSLLRSFNQ